MQRSLTLLVVVLSLLMGTLTTVSAQDATPAAVAAGGPAVVYGSDGQPDAEIAVHSFTDPFEEVDPSAAPQRGFHYAGAVLSITATRTIDVSVYGFSLVDTDGFVYPLTFIFRTSESNSTLPDLPGGTLEAGQSQSGAVFFQVLDGITPAFIFYQPSYDRVVTITDLRDSQVAQGTPVDVLGSDGQPAAKITVEDVVTPVKDYTTSNAPKRGFEYVGVNVTIENTGAGDFEIDPYTISIVDDLGFVYTSYGAFRTEEGEAAMPSLQSGTLAAGESVTGLLTYSVLAGTKPGIVYYASSFDRQVRLAEFAETQVGGPDGQMPEFPATPVADDTDIDVDVDEDPNATVVTTEGCEGVIDWGNATVENLGGWYEVIIGVGSLATGDVTGVAAADITAAADATSAVADAQEAIDTPDPAADAQEQLVSFYRSAADQLNTLADAVESGDQAAIDTATADFVSLMENLSSDEGDLGTTMSSLVTTCPELDSIGG